MEQFLPCAPTPCPSASLLFPSKCQERRGTEPATKISKGAATLAKVLISGGGGKGAVAAASSMANDFESSPIVAPARQGRSRRQEKGTGGLSLQPQAVAAKRKDLHLLVYVAKEYSS